MSESGATFCVLVPFGLNSAVRFSGRGLHTATDETFRSGGIPPEAYLQGVVVVLIRVAELSPIPAVATVQGRSSLDLARARPAHSASAPSTDVSENPGESTESLTLRSYVQEIEDAAQPTTRPTSVRTKILAELESLQESEHW